jgi:DNA-binding response OmpR family regulator
MPVFVGLVMDEDVRARHLLAEGLRRHGMQIVEAGSPAEALALAQFGRLQFVIVNADGEGGLCRELRASAVTATLPVVVLTSDVKRTGTVHVADGTVRIARPVAVDDLASTIVRMVPTMAALP